MNSLECWTHAILLAAVAVLLIGGLIEMALK